VVETDAPNGAAVMATASHSPTAGPREKRKAAGEEEEGEKPAKAANGHEQEKSSEGDEQRPDKKAKLAEKIADKVSETKDKVESKVKGKPGRPKKDTKAPPPVGRTERKTRSQGLAVD
jgi:hypothetical protein